MNAVTESGERLVTPAVSGGTARVLTFVHALLLFVGGVVFALTASLHSDLAFDRVLLAGVFVVIAALRVAEWAVTPKPRRAVALVFAAISLIAAVVLSVMQLSAGPVDPTGATHDALLQSVLIAMVIAGWALAQGLLEFIGGVVGAAKRQESVFFGATAILLALLVLLTREDTIAVIGFFGAYLIIAGVFLGISAADSRGARSAAAADIETGAPAAASDAS